jgi:hypothetical protein
MLAGREIPDRPGPEDLEVHPAPCIFCGRKLRHISDGGDGSIVNAIVDGVARRYFCCSDGPCLLEAAPWIWRCGCDEDYIENIGDHCGCCRRHRRMARTYERIVCPRCGRRYELNDRGGIGRSDACPYCTGSLYWPVPYVISPPSVGTTPESLCQALLDAVEEHGLASEGYETIWGDLEDFFRAAFGLLTRSQRERFWNDQRVAWLLDQVEFEAIAEAVYGLSGEDGEK